MTTGQTFPQSIQRKALLWSLAIQHIILLALAVSILLGTDTEAVRQAFDTVAWAIAANLVVIVGDSAYRKMVAGKWGIK